MLALRRTRRREEEGEGEETRSSVSTVHDVYYYESVLTDLKHAGDSITRVSLLKTPFMSS